MTLEHLVCSEWLNAVDLPRIENDFEANMALVIYHVRGASFRYINSTAQRDVLIEQNSAFHVSILLSF